MKVLNWIMYIMNLVGISLILIIPIFNIWYLNQLMEEDLFKQCKGYWINGSHLHGIQHQEEKDGF